MKALDQATKTNETWGTSKTHASLTEQAMVLYSAAKVFQRLRPRNQRNIRSIFEKSGGTIPENAYTLPIAFLPGTAKVLENSLINQDQLEIYQVADAPARVSINRVRASITGITRLIAAMHLWVTETQDISDLQVSASIRDQLTKGHATMKKLLRLGVQSFLADFVREDNTGRGPFGILMTSNRATLQPPTLAEAAEALSTIALVEQQLLPSPFLRQRVFQLYHWFAGTYLRNLATGQMSEISASDVIWTRQALQRFAYYPDAKETRWFQSAYDVLSSQIADWDGRLP